MASMFNMMERKSTKTLKTRVLYVMSVVKDLTEKISQQMRLCKDTINIKKSEETEKNNGWSLCSLKVTKVTLVTVWSQKVTKVTLITVVTVGH